MVINIKRLFIPFAVFLSMQLSYAQLGFSHEIGVIAGPIAYQSDFGVRYDFETNSGNTGFIILTLLIVLIVIVTQLTPTSMIILN